MLAIARLAYYVNEGGSGQERTGGLARCGRGQCAQQTAVLDNACERYLPTFATLDPYEREEPNLAEEPERVSVTTISKLDFRNIWQNAITFSQFVQEAQENKGLWEGIYRTTTVPQWAVEKVSERGGGLRLLLIAEDWCGDASNTVPVMAKLGDAADGIDVRIIGRDDNPEMMDRYLTNGARSIPIAIMLDCDFNEIGHWGPRPTELQQWVMDNKDRIPKEKRYPQVRRWYAKDKGVSTLRELLELL